MADTETAELKKIAHNVNGLLLAEKVWGKYERAELVMPKEFQLQRNVIECTTVVKGA